MHNFYKHSLFTFDPCNFTMYFEAGKTVLDMYTCLRKFFRPIEDLLLHQTWLLLQWIHWLLPSRAASMSASMIRDSLATRYWTTLISVTWSSLEAFQKLDHRFISLIRYMNHMISFGDGFKYVIFQHLPADGKPTGLIPALLIRTCQKSGNLKKSKLLWYLPSGSYRHWLIQKYFEKSQHLLRQGPVIDQSWNRSDISLIKLFLILATRSPLYSSLCIILSRG